MDGLSQETLAFLIDIQQHGANQLRALSADFGTLGATSERISKQLATLQGELDRVGAQATAAGEKMTTSAKGAASAAEAQAKATEGVTTAQKSNVASSDAVVAANDRLAKTAQASAGAAKGQAAGLDAQAAAAKRAEGATVAASRAGGAHGKVLDEHASKLKKVEQGLGSFGRAMNNVSLPIVAVSGYAIKMGLDFEAAMERLHGQAGYAQKDIAGLEKAVLKASPHLARTPNELAEALYHVASVGVPAAHAMQVVSAAAIAANIGNANLEHTTNGLVIVMKSLHQPASMAKEDMALLNEIVGAGNLRMEDLVTSLGKVLPQAQNFGLGLRDVGAALDVMTSRGIDAQMASTRLGMTFNLMGNPSVTAQKALGTLGLSSTSLASDLRKPQGLLVAVEDLKHHLDKTFPVSSARKLTVDEERHALETYKKSLEETGVSGTKLKKNLEEYATKLVHMGSAAVQQSQVLSSAFGRGRQSATILTLVQNLDDLRRMYGRLPEGEKALARLADAQSQWEKTSAGQFDSAKASIQAAMTEIGKSLGPVVVPVIKDLATDVQDLAHAFEGLPTPVQHVIEDVTALVAILGPAAFLASKLIGASRAIGGVGVGIARKLGYGATPPIIETPTGGGGVGSIARGLTGSIFGIRGPAEPGSLLNPVAVQVLGTGGAFGGSGMLTQVERDAAAAEHRTPGGVILPRGVSAGTVIEDAAGATGAVGLGSKVLTIGKGLAGGVLRGGGIALGGMAVSDIAGSLVGGKTGSLIGKIGTDASIGAGLGSLIGPEGTVIGAVGGALVGGLGKLFSEPSLGDKVASEIGKGFTPAIKKAQSDAINAATQDPHGHGTQSKLALAGQATAAGLEHQVSQGVRFLEVGAIVKQVEQRFQNVQLPKVGSPAMVTREMQEQANLDKLMPQFRHAGIKSIIEFTAGMQAQGRLPQGATDQLIKDLEKKWPGLAEYLRQIGMSSMKELTHTIENRQAVEAAGSLVQKIKNEFGGEFGKLAAELKEDGGSMSKEWGTTLEFLLSQTHSKMPQVRQAAEHDLTALKGNSARIVGGWVQQLTEQLHKGGANAVSNFQGSMSNIVVVIKELMAKGIISTKEGMAAISKVTHTELRELGAGPTKGEVQKSHSFGPGVEPGAAPFASNPLMGATGMRVPGPVGPDNVGVFSPGGRLRGIVAGGEILVANRHTEDRVNRMLAAYGTSLGAEVAGEHRPHSAPRFAKGGLIVHGPVSTFGPPGEAAGGTAYGRSSSEAGIAVNPHGGAAWNDALAQSLAMKVARVTVAGHVANLRVIDKGPSAVGAHGPRLIDITGAGVSALGIPYGSFPTDSIGTAEFGPGVGPAATIGGAGGDGFHPIARVIAKGVHGIVGHIAQAAIDRARAAANHKLRSIAAARAASMTSAGGIVTATGGAPTGGGFDPAQLGTFDGLHVAKWIIPELRYGRAHGWTGPVTSGYRSGFDPHAPAGSEHALDIYPGGAVDFGGMIDPAGAANRAAFIAATAGYSGHKLLTPIGFRDDGHMSGTGHALGGRMNFAGAFGHGGVATAATPTMAVFGDRGPETAIFIPHTQVPRAETGNQLLEEIGVTPTAPKVPAGQKVVEGLNPDNNEIEYRSESEWKSIRLHHAQASHAAAAAKKKKGKIPEVEEAVRLDGLDVGTILSKSGAPIDVPRDVGRLSAQTWKKVVSAIKHTLKQTGGPANAAFDVQAVGKLAREHQTPRVHELTGQAIQTSAKTILSVTRNLPSEQAVTGGAVAINQLRALIADARRSNNKTLIATLTKDIQATIKSTASAILQTVSNAPSGEATRAAATGVRQLQALVLKARANGSHAVELTLFKDIQKTIAAWQSAISSSLSVATSRTTAKENLKVARKNLASIRAGGGGVKLSTSDTDASFLRDEEADQRNAIKQFEQERAQLSKLVKQLDGQLRKALKKHHKAQAKAIEAEIREIDSQIGEVTTAIGESTTNIAQLQIEFAQHVYEEVKGRIADAEQAMESTQNKTSLEGQIAAARAHVAGTDLAGLQEDAQKQGGVLTPGQVAQAKRDQAEFAAQAGHEEKEKEDQRAYAESQLGNLTGPDRTAEEEKILQLTLAIEQLKGSVVDNAKATEQLTEATKANSNTMAQFTGSVTFQYQNQQYVVGQTSDLASAPSVGL